MTKKQQQSSCFPFFLNKASCSKTSLFPSVLFPSLLYFHNFTLLNMPEPPPRSALGIVGICHHCELARLHILSKYTCARICIIENQFAHRSIRSRFPSSLDPILIHRQIDPSDTLQVLQSDSRPPTLLVSLSVGVQVACPCTPPASSVCCSSLVEVYPCQLSNH